jgi:hypothetical protein
MPPQAPQREAAALREERAADAAKGRRPMARIAG